MVKFINRLTGKISTELPENLLLNQWLIMPESEQITINGVQITPNTQTYLYGDSAYNFSLIGGQQIKLKIPKWQINPELLNETMRFFYLKSQQLNLDNLNLENWQKLLDLSPLLPEINAKIHQQILEIKTQEKWGHLATVCHRPRTYLKIETEKLPTSRVKKIAPRAIENLAAHTEDWYRRNFSSVNPKKLLCQVREDLVNIYENQVTAKLIDNLLAYINHRIAELKLIKAELDEALDFSTETHKIYWRNRERICQLWGENFEPEIGIIETEETLEQLQQIKGKLLELMNTDLYKAIPKQTNVPITLKRTNIFINDQHYKHIDLLWRNWSKWRTGQLKTPLEFFQENQEIFQGFEAFCFLLICQALTGNNTNRGFGFELINTEIQEKSNRVFNFHSDLGNLKLQWSKTGTFYLHCENLNKDLQIIPLLLNLTGCKDEQIINLIVEQLINQLNKSVNNVILYLGTKEERELLSLDLQKRINRMEIKGDSLIGLLPVSPFEIVSLERVAYALQWWLNGQIYLSYPPVLNFNLPDYLLKTCHHAVEKTEKPQQFRVICSLSPAEENDFNQEFKTQLNTAQTKGKLGKNELKELKALQAENIPEKISQLIKPFTICPVCQNKDNMITRLNNHSFYCECSNCQSTWGTKHCGNCQQNYPFIAVQGIENPQLSYDDTNLDRVFGRDILAIPKRENDNKTTFICSFCGAN